MNLAKLASIFSGKRNRPATGRAAIGRAGEEHAASFLKRERKFRIICRNWRGAGGEIDIVAWDGPVLVFVEVRTRDADTLIPGFFTVSRNKKRILRRVCTAYLRAMPEEPHGFRFDIAEVRHRGAQSFEVNHYENIILFPR